MAQTTLTRLDYLLAGNATFTLKSRRTDDHLTFNVKKHKTDPRHFVRMKVGNDYLFVGTIFDRNRFGPGRNVPPDRVTKFKWFWDRVMNLPEVCEFHISGACCRCGRPLTDPASITLGVGPECLTKM